MYQCTSPCICMRVTFSFMCAGACIGSAAIGPTHPMPDIFFTEIKQNFHSPSDNSRSNSANFSRISSERLAKSTSISDIFLSTLCTHYIYMCINTSTVHTHTHYQTNFRRLRFAHQQGKKSEKENLSFNSASAPQFLPLFGKHFERFHSTTRIYFNFSTFFHSQWPGKMGFSVGFPLFHFAQYSILCDRPTRHTKKFYHFTSLIAVGCVFFFRCSFTFLCVCVCG